MGIVDKLFAAFWNFTLNPFSWLERHETAEPASVDRYSVAPRISEAAAITYGSSRPSSLPGVRFSRQPIEHLEHMMPHRRDGMLMYFYGIVDEALHSPGGRAEADILHYQTSGDDLAGVAGQLHANFALLYDMTHVESPDEFAGFVRTYFSRSAVEISRMLDKKTPEAMNDVFTYRRESFWGSDSYIRRIFDRRSVRDWEEDPRLNAVDRYVTDRLRDLSFFDNPKRLAEVWRHGEIERVQSMRVLANLSFRILARTLQIIFPHVLVSAMEGVTFDVDIDKYFFYRQDMDTALVDNIWDRLAAISRRHHRREGGDRRITVTWDPERYVFVIEDNGAGIGNLSDAPDFVSAEESVGKLGWTMDIYSRRDGGTTFTVHPKRGDILTEEEFDPSLRNEGRGNVTGLASTGETSGTAGVARVVRRSSARAGARRCVSARHGRILTSASTIRAAGFRAVGIRFPAAARGPVTAI